jgi:hypothetical protein
MVTIQGTNGMQDKIKIEWMFLPRNKWDSITQVTAILGLRGLPIPWQISFNIDLKRLILSNSPLKINGEAISLNSTRPKIINGAVALVRAPSSLLLVRTISIGLGRQVLLTQTLCKQVRPHNGEVILALIHHSDRKDKLLLLYANIKYPIQSIRSI